VIVPVVSPVMGMVFSILVDRMRFQVIAKSLIFMPTAISFVGASLIWKYVYQYRSPGLPQIGLLSEVVMKLGWAHPPNWLLSAPLNTFLLMVILVWIETGFAMVILGAAIRSVPDDVIEAARVDGAKGWRLFRSVQLPMISSTVTVVIITIMTATLKIFDIVYTITGGDFKTDTLSNEMYTQIFESFNTGRGSALAVILFMAVVPLVTVSILRLRKERYA
jgi:alpha-glucoside transport system permease protein